MAGIVVSSQWAGKWRPAPPPKKIDVVHLANLAVVENSTVCRNDKVARRVYGPDDVLHVVQLRLLRRRVIHEGRRGLGAAGAAGGGAGGAAAPVGRRLGEEF